MAEKPDNIELKFNGESVRRLNGAPADAVIASLNALQRMVYIIGMMSEGRILSERLKPTAKVRQEYAIVCHAPEKGSHVQPFNVASQNGAFTPATVAARKKLLEALKAFDSGNEEVVKQVLPNARERWFMAKAALGLLPSEDSDLEITVRAGSRGPFNFKAERARTVLAKYKTGSPPEIDEEVVAGKLQAIDFSRTILAIKPSNQATIRIDYPLSTEEWLKQNVRKRLKITGRPKINQKGDIASFKEVYSVTELEPTLEAISSFQSGSQTIQANRTLSIPVTLNWKDKIFSFQDSLLGIDAFALTYDKLRESVLEELDILWRHYALAPDDELDAEAQSVKVALLSRFKVISA
ncbi:MULTISPECIES: hypothetical protein [unclassified Acidocella]|uniref:hypothetical protein n=1 Tax=unclassified Acidocella TaxID=2648610 RepID=UPI0011819230|nr:MULTISPECIES: hypothetical protein [unclassified Acidocella]WBO58613.1 hypothetical protein GT370_15840 [Acidocella sp. MX-AZ03]